MEVTIDAAYPRVDTLIFLGGWFSPGKVDLVLWLTEKGSLPRLFSEGIDCYRSCATEEMVD